MINRTTLFNRLRLGILISLLPMLGFPAQAQTTPNVGGGGGEPPIKKNLVAYWNFDDNNFNDSVGIFTGTGNGTDPIVFTSGKNGFGKAIRTDGVDQWVEITGGEPDNLAFEGGSLSVSVWFKVGTFDKNWQALVAKGESGNWRIHRRGGETGMAYTGGPSGDTPTGVAVNDGQWHHLVAITDKDAINFGTALYIDGVLDTQRAETQVLAANGQRMAIADNPGARNRFWNGEIDDVAVWDRVLTEAEIGQLYSNGAGKPVSQLLGVVVGDADSDGIPDWAEIAYGLNPNDGSDAAKDNNGNGVSNLEDYNLGLDPNDATRPEILSVASSGTFDTVRIAFSKALDPATAEVAGNYSISPAVAVTAATYKNKVVALTTAKQTPDTAYKVTVKGVKDISRFEVPAESSTVDFYSYIIIRDGVLKFAYWANIPGTPVENLWADLRFPDSPDMVGAVFSFNSRDIFPNDSNNNYGALIEGYLTPTESGQYDFFSRSDDASELYISTDDKEANLVWAAEERDCCDPFYEPGVDDATTFAPVSLTAGRKYFIRLIYKEGGGGDFGQVAWRKVGVTTPAASLTPIPGKFLSAAVDLPAPAEGSFVTRFPAPNARNVKPGAAMMISHRDGKVPWTAANVSLKIDGTAVTPEFTKDGNLATIAYTPTGLFASKSTHKISLGYTDPGGKPATQEWSFEIGDYKGPVKDLVNGHPALLLGAVNLTPDKGGFSGKDGDLAADFGRGSGQSILVSDASFLNTAVAGDQVTFSLWVKKYDTANNSAFWADSPSSNGTLRGAQAHIPWSNNNLYFDTAGCCNGATQRINAGIDTFPGYTGDITWWTGSWHHFAFTKNASVKQIWVDGVLFLEGDNSSPLPTDFERIWIGAQGGGPNTGTANNFHGLIDDFAIYGSALSSADIQKLAAGQSPSSLGAGTKMAAYWDFNSIAAPAESAKFTKIAKNADGSITLEWSGGGALEAAGSITGPWQAVPGATSPYKLTPTAAQQFGRIRQ